jgi:hypothetical protein
MRIWMLVIIFLLLGAFFIVSNHGLHLSDAGEVKKFFGEYYSWAGGLLGNVRSLAGYIIEAKWLPSENATAG